MKKKTSQITISHVQFVTGILLIPTSLLLGDLPHLKALKSFGNCQRPVFSLGVYQYKHKITSL